MAKKSAKNFFHETGVSELKDYEVKGFLIIATTSYPYLCRPENEVGISAFAVGDNTRIKN